MAHGTSSSVRSIIDAFVNGFDILARLRDRQQRKKDRQAKERREEHSTRLSRSLRQGSHDVGYEYQRGMQGLGEAYARGDGIAHSSLAEILLKLNTGLVSIIASFLDNDRRKGDDVDFSALTSLSERSRRESLDVLRQLYQRTASRRIPARVRSKDDLRKPRAPNSASAKKIRGPTIARVTIEDSSKRSQLAVVKPGVKRKSPSSSSTNLLKAKSASSSTTAVDSLLSTKSSPRLPAAKLPHQTTAPLSKEEPVKLKSPRQAAKSSPDLLPSYTAPPVATSPQMASSPPSQPRARRKLTPTMYSMATDSTQLGEIPLHRWAVPYDFDEQSMKNRQAMQSGWPLVDLNGNAVVKPKKKFGLLGMFRKKSAPVTSIVA